METSTELLLAEYIERREMDPELTPEKFLTEHPVDGRELVRALTELQQINEMFLTSTLGR